MLRGVGVVAVNAADDAGEDPPGAASFVAAGKRPLPPLTVEASREPSLPINAIAARRRCGGAVVAVNAVDGAGEDPHSAASFVAAGSGRRRH